ncbi:hypothetical protein Bsp3421_000128 (plasmid) [Burkholderia sp. FERM BP-3421]|uniref:hypothetical protein n=1 Tax=Burkholderia sp. FERM BP-3421 TaxID=1494466 RepID=UPI00235F23AB|nr:hypothetical protein [Burkholderia sp. FERM BP-3421]WDD90303.1 hypothetical protein Bsp3421_000128 [Burkholderia sp. FERM BP-3421]
MDRQYVRAVGAAELESKYTIKGTAYSAGDIIATPGVSNEVMSAWLGVAGNDLRKKCNEFIARLSVQEAGWDTGLDIVALATGGAAAVAVLPVTTTAALAAGSTFATGTRALIDSDVYGKVGANLIASQIGLDFDPVLSAYMKNLNVSNTADFESKLDTLMQAQGKCTLHNALQNLQLKGAGASSRPPVIAATSLQDKQVYSLLGGVEVTLTIDASDQVTLKGYTGDPSVSRTTATAILNGAQAVLETK